MIHLECGTYFKDILYRCPCCGMVWCPRCRELFRPSGDTGKEESDA